MGWLWDWKKINWTNFFGAVAAVFVLGNAFGFAVHHKWLGPDYHRVAQLWRPETQMDSYMPFMWLATLLFSWAFVWVYAQGWEQKPWMQQGFRFAVLVWLLTCVPTFLTYYAIQPLPGQLVWKQIWGEFFTTLFLGWAVAWLYKPAKARA